MGESQQVRLQQDIVDEIKQHEGGSFSEKFRNWKQAEIHERMEKMATCDDLLTKSEVRQAVEEALPSGLF